MSRPNDKSKSFVGAKALANEEKYPYIIELLLRPDERRSAGLNFQSGHLVDVNRKRVTQFNLCPSCGRSMQAISKSEIYECKECRVFVTQSG